MSAWIVMLDDMDERLLHALVLRRRPRLDLVMTGITHLAHPAVAISFTAALALGLVPALQEVGEVAFATMILSHLLVQILKRSITRPRPDLPVGIQSLIRTPECFSFPSGHAAAGLSIFLPLALALPLPLAIPLGILGFLVGISRCYLGVHYPGDVAMGWLLAALSMLPFARPDLVVALLP